MSGYLIGLLVPPMLVVMALWVHAFSEPDESPNCWDAPDSYCNRTWLLAGLLLLVSVAAVTCIGPLLCRFSVNKTHQPGATGTAWGTLELSPLYLVPASLAAEGLGTFVFGVLILAVAIPVVARTIWWVLDQGRGAPDR